MSQRFYSDEEAEAILKLASRKSGDTSMSRETLMATATELGISPEAVEEAEKTYRIDKQDVEDRVLYTKHKRGEFFNSLLGLLSTCGVLAAINYYTEGRFTWVFWVVLFSGAGVFSTFREAFLLTGDERDKSFRRWQRKRIRRAQIADGSRLTAEEQQEEARAAHYSAGAWIESNNRRQEIRPRR